MSELSEKIKSIYFQPINHYNNIIGIRIKSNDLFVTQSQNEFPNIIKRDNNPDQIASLTSKKDIISYLMDEKTIITDEVQFNQIPQQIVNVTSECLGIRLCFAVCTRSISLIAQYCIQKNGNELNSKNKKIGSKLIKLLQQVERPLSFSPDFQESYTADYGNISPNLASPTALAVSKKAAYVGYNGTQTTIIKVPTNNLFTQQLKQEIFSIKRPQTPFSLSFAYDRLFLISTDQPIYIFTNEGTYTKASSKSNPQHPCTSDGYYLYSLENDKIPRVKQFIYSANEDLFILLRTISLNVSIPDIDENIFMATNGTYLGVLVKNENSRFVRIFSLFDGAHLGDTAVKREEGDQILFAWSFDPNTLGHLCLTSDGLFLLPGRATRPLWQLGIMYPEPSKNLLGTSSDSLLAAFYSQLLELTAHFLGGSDNIPLSVDDQTCIVSLSSMLESVISQPEIDLNSVHSTLALIQLKARNYPDQSLSTIANSIGRILDERSRVPDAKVHASFVVLSLWKMFKKTNIAKDLLIMIASEPKCTDLLIQYFDLEVFGAEYLTPVFVSCFSDSLLRAGSERASKVLNILNSLQIYFLENLNDTKISEMFVGYSSSLFSIFNEEFTKDNGVVHSNEQDYYTTYSYPMCWKLMDYLVDHDIFVPQKIAKKIYIMPLALQISLDTVDQRHIDMFAKAIYLTYRIECMHIMSDEKLTCYQTLPTVYIHPKFELQYKGEIENIVIPIIEKSIGVETQKDIDDFVCKLKKMVEEGHPIEELKKKCDMIEEIMPQPFRKIQRLLLEPNSQISIERDGLILPVLISSIKWFKGLKIDYEKIFRVAAKFIDDVVDDILCLPVMELKRFIEAIPNPYVIRPEILIASKWAPSTEEVLGMQIGQLEEALDHLCLISNSLNQEELIEPVMSILHLISVGEGALSRSLMLATIAICGDKTNGIEKVILPIKRSLVFVTDASYDSFLRALKAIMEQMVEGYDEIPFFLMEIISRGMNKDRSLYPSISCPTTYFKLVMETVDMCRELISAKDPGFCSFFQLKDRITHNELFALSIICQNSIDLIRPGVKINIAYQTGERVCGRVISADERFIKINDDQIIPMRKIRHYTTQGVKFEANAIDNFVSVALGFKKFEPKSLVEEAFRIVSLQEFIGIPEFVKLFGNENIIKEIEGPIDSFENQELRLFHLSSRIFSFDMDNPPFCLNSKRVTSSIRSVEENDSIVHIEGTVGSLSKDDYLVSSPLCTSTHYKLSFSAAEDIEQNSIDLGVQGQLRGSTSCLSLHPVKVSKNFSIEIDPTKQTLEIVSQSYKTVYELYPAAESIYLLVSAPNCVIDFTVEVSKLIEQPGLNPYTRGGEPPMIVEAQHIDVPQSSVTAQIALQIDVQRVVRVSRHLMVAKLLQSDLLQMNIEIASEFAWATLLSQSSLEPKLVNLSAPFDSALMKLKDVVDTNELCRKMISQLDEVSKSNAGQRIWAQNRRVVPVPRNTQIPSSYFAIPFKGDVQKALKISNSMTFLVPRDNHTKTCCELLSRVVACAQLFKMIGFGQKEDLLRIIEKEVKEGNPAFTSFFDISEFVNEI